MIIGSSITQTNAHESSFTAMDKCSASIYSTVCAVIDTKAQTLALRSSHTLDDSSFSFTHLGTQQLYCSFRLMSVSIGLLAKTCSSCTWTGFVGHTNTHARTHSQNTLNKGWKRRQQWNERRRRVNREKVDFKGIKVVRNIVNFFSASTYFLRAL